MQWLLCIDFICSHFDKLIYSKGYFYRIFSEIYIYIYVCIESISRDHFTFFLICMPFIYCSCLTALARTSSNMLNRSCEASLVNFVDISTTAINYTKSFSVSRCFISHQLTSLPLIIAYICVDSSRFNNS